MTKKAMTEKRIYPGVNCFKLAAALFVIMIHTSPLTFFSAEADFVLTRILARTAVPFFFMVTGFFVLPKALGDTAKDYAICGASDLSTLRPSCCISP